MVFSSFFHLTPKCCGEWKDDLGVELAAVGSELSVLHLHPHHLWMDCKTEKYYSIDFTKPR
jgi:hypothetical protein